MSYVNKRKGFYPLKYANGAPWTGKSTAYAIPAADTAGINIGDVVKLETTGNALGLPTCTRATAGAIGVGVVVGIDPGYLGNPTVSQDFMFGGSLKLDAPIYRPAAAQNTDWIVWVVDDPQVIFIAEEDGDTTPLTMGNLGSNVDLIAGSLNTTTGVSNMMIDSTTTGTGNTLNFNLIGLYREPGNDFYSSGNNTSSTVYGWPKYMVMFNRKQFRVDTGSTGLA